jgi:hypothetical protein
MSKRRRPGPERARSASEPAREASGRREPREATGPRHARGGRGRRGGGSLLRDIIVLAAAFGIGVGVAELFGAANLGVAFGVGQVVFAVVLVVLLTRG